MTCVRVSAVRWALGIGILAAGLALASCSSSSSSSTPQGTLVGQMVMDGPAASGTTQPVSGAVVAVSSSGRTATAVVGASGTFHLVVPVGSYGVVGTRTGGLDDSCVSHGKVAVRATAITTVRVVCPAR
jgi:hypothetical protein